MMWYVSASYQTLKSVTASNIRDRQTWTAFGIMLGFVADLAFYRVSDKPHITGLNWRLMLSSVSNN